MTGGTIENMKETPADSPVVTTLNGPSSGGGKVIGGQSRNIGPGDVVIIPPNTPTGSPRSHRTRSFILW